MSQDLFDTERETGVRSKMSDAELIAALAGKLSPEELKILASKLKRKPRTEIKPTDQETADFERLWKVRKEYPSRPGDPKKPALLEYCRRMRETPATVEEIIFGIRCEYSKPRENPSLYCQMRTFMHQRRWEAYDYQAVKARQQDKSGKIVQMPRTVRPKNHFLNKWESGEIKKSNA